MSSIPETLREAELPISSAPTLRTEFVALFSINLFSSNYTKVFVKFSKPAVYSEGYLNKEPITLTQNNIPIFDNAIVWFELRKENVEDFGTHSLYLGKVVDCKTIETEERVAYMGDTRMKYGGVPRGGH